VDGPLVVDGFTAEGEEEIGVLRRDGQVHMLVKDDVDLLLFDQDVARLLGLLRVAQAPSG